ncbi:MAG: hypothetical protein HY874_02045 [Chloroflexi bacterium]|nr:hypothetical protein [Chloroflexota bacterium]
MTRRPQQIKTATDDMAPRKPGSERRYPVRVRSTFLRLPRAAAQAAA